MGERKISWSALSVAVSHHLAATGEWCGIPMPVEGLTIELESKNPWAARTHELDAIVNDRNLNHVCTDADLDCRVINQWHSKSLRCMITIVEDQGKRYAMRSDFDSPRRCDFLVHQIGASMAWSLEAELKAQAMLQTLVLPHTWKSYALTGSFLETSEHSRHTYLFRRGRPTVVLAPVDSGVKIICTLCMHPIGYYRNTFAGSLTPTDDVIAHLLLMRADEHLFWRRANQHPTTVPESGL